MVVRNPAEQRADDAAILLLLRPSRVVVEDREKHERVDPDRLRSPPLAQRDGVHGSGWVRRFVAKRVQSVVVFEWLAKQVVSARTHQHTLSESDCR